MGVYRKSTIILFLVISALLIASYSNYLVDSSENMKSTNQKCLDAKTLFKCCVYDVSRNIKMKCIYMADVDDGFCAAIQTIFGDTIQIDCGGQKYEVAFNGFKRILYHFLGLDIFVLSHFHIDHYNGLLYASSIPYRRPSFKIREVYYPRIPEFKEKEEFLYCLLAMNMRIFGSETGIMEYDFLKAISRINNRISFKYRALSKSDTVDINGSIFEVLWPPAVMREENILSKVRRAIKDFKRAREEDELAWRLYERVKEEGIWKKYLERQGEIIDFKEHNHNEKWERKRLPEVVKKANKSLKDAANHLSLALFEDERFLFLGDAGNFEIKQIVNDLKSRNRENFYIFITPHHGTYWSNCLREIRCTYSISSNGSKLGPKMKPHFKKISKISLATWINGNIMIYI
jgi:glyoxylase-like metal-dependent hydrolase (beta-lactamase superfamily II)